MRKIANIFFAFGIIFLCINAVIASEEGQCSEDYKPPSDECKGEYEQYTDCVCPCCENCSNLGQDVTCNFLACHPGCDCKPGYFHNGKGECVPPEKCECKKNEEYDPEWNPCPPQTCSDIGKVIKCMPTKKPACKCKWNHRRDENNICIPIEDCPPLECGENEEYNHCPDDCFDDSCKGLTDPLVCTAQVRECQPRCVCIQGYRRDDSGLCIKDTKCITCDDPNAEVIHCPSPCPGGTCEQPEFALCKAPCRYIGCQCKEGYVKDKNGKCITLSKCSKKESESCEKHSNSHSYSKSHSEENKCDWNQVYKSCGTACPAICNEPTPKFCTKQCVSGCFCKEGFILSKKGGKCIAISKCKKKESSSQSQSHSCSEERKCGKYEVYLNCGTACPATCKNKNPICTKQCVPGCFCKKGYILDENNGNCIPVYKCPTKDSGSCDETCEEEDCGKHEIYSECGNNGCQNTCKNPTLSHVCKGPCISGCICEEGYLRNSKNECVLPNKCDNDKKCGKHEEYSECGNNGCQNTCENPTFSHVCKGICISGCVCKEGYLLNSKNKCVHPKHCDHDKKCKTHEEYNPCGTACPPHCKDKNPTCTEQCVPGCFCEKGYILDEPNGKCIKEKKCDGSNGGGSNGGHKKCKKHEKYNQCGTARPPTCKDKNPVCTKQCVPGCYCKDGYILDKPKGKCIKVKKCPKIHKDSEETCSNEKECGENEEYSECGNNGCQDTCQDPTFSHRCKGSCIPGCVCKEGFLKDPEGKCVHPDDCGEPIKCGSNEEYKECGTKCPRTCKKKNPICTFQCVPGCFCKSGFILHKGKCIEEKHCPKKGSSYSHSNTKSISKEKKCKNHQKYNKCGTACPPTCDNRNPICHKKCVSGCFCKKNYVLYKGKCIKARKCPKKNKHKKQKHNAHSYSYSKSSS